jgi:hypothetical protein
VASAQRVRCLYVGRRNPRCERGGDRERRFRQFCGNEVEGMDNLLLSNAIDASDALLEAARIPRELEIPPPSGSGGAG